MSSTHLFFDSVFDETHPELIDLQESFSKMKISFQLDADFNEETEQEVLVISDIEDESSEESYQETEILSNEQIKKFKNIYLKKIFIVISEFLNFDLIKFGNDLRLRGFGVKNLIS